MWHLKTINIIVVGALGMTKKEADKNINKVLGNISQYILKKLNLSGTIYLLRRVLSM